MNLFVLHLVTDATIHLYFGIKLPKIILIQNATFWYSNSFVMLLCLFLLFVQVSFCCPSFCLIFCLALSLIVNCLAPRDTLSSFFYQLLCLQLHAVVGEPEHHRLPPRPPSEHLKVLRYNAPRDKGPSKKRYEMKFSVYWVSVRKDKAKHDKRTEWVSQFHRGASLLDTSLWNGDECVNIVWILLLTLE